MKGCVKQNAKIGVSIPHQPNNCYNKELVQWHIYIRNRISIQRNTYEKVRFIIHIHVKYMKPCHKSRQKFNFEIIFNSSY